MNLMQSRVEQLEAALEGLQRADVPLVAYAKGTYYAAGFSDDPGIYHFIPQIAVLLDVSLANAVDRFFAGLLVAGFALGCVGVVTALRSWTGRLIGVMALIALARWAYLLGDVYIAYFTASAGGTYIAIAALRWRLAITAPVVFLLGLFGGLLHLVRSNSATPLVAFILIAFCLAQGASRWRVVVVAIALASGAAAPQLWFDALERERDTFLSAASNSREGGAAHPVWHSIYIGMGYITNAYGIEYSDEVAASKVAEVAPDADYLSPEYEAVLREEVLRIVRSDRQFVFQLLMAKAGVALGYVLLFANIGLFAAYRYRPPARLTAAFVAAGALSSLFGILVIPAPDYLLGLATISVLFGVWTIDHAIGEGMIGDTVRSVRGGVSRFPRLPMSRRTAEIA